MMKIAALHFDCKRNRWFGCQSGHNCRDCDHHGYCKSYVLPEGSNLAEGYESRWCKGKPLYPIFEGKRLQRYTDINE